jgi:hypothetical protein
LFSLPKTSFGEISKNNRLRQTLVKAARQKVKGDILRACVHVRATTLILKYIGKGDVQALGAELLIVAAGYIN